MSFSTFFREIQADSAGLTDFKGQGYITHVEEHMDLAIAATNNTHLKTVSLEQTNLTNAVAIQWGETLKVNSSIQTMDVSLNHIQSEGAIALAEALAVNKTMKDFRMSSQAHAIGPAAELALAKLWDTNTTLQRLSADFKDKKAIAANAAGEVRNKMIAARIRAGKDWSDLDPAKREEFAKQKEAERAAKREAEAKRNAPITTKVESTGGPYSYKQLTCLIDLRPDDVDPHNRANYLTDEEFQEVMGMNKEAFAKLARWKKSRLKKQKGLF